MFDIQNNEILLSWKKCYKNGVEKNIEKLQNKINEDKLKSKKEKHKNLIKLFNKNLEKLLRKYTVTDAVFLLTDKDLVLISKKAVIEIEPHKIKEGFYFDENSCGTNAISMAKKMDGKVYLKGDDHYCYFFQDWGCIAAPIKKDGEVIGFLDMSVLEREIREKDKMFFEILLNNIRLKSINFSMEDSKVSLKEKEIKVLELAAKGYSIKETGENMNLSSPAITYHRKNICKKLKAKNVTHAVAKALQKKIF